MEITPVTRTMEKVISEQGTAFRCFGPHNAHYFEQNGVLRPINVLAIAKDQLTTGKMTADIRNSHVVSVGINKAPSLEKIVGLRKDDCQDGREQLEITLESATYNNVPVTLNADYREKFNPLVDVVGNLRVYSDRHRTRVALPATNSVSKFRIAFKIHTVGLTATQEGNRFVFRNAKGEFRYALTEPKILKPDGNIYRFGDPEKGKYWFDNTVAHHLEDLGKGEYRYIKESTDLFREMPTAFLIDADTCYAGTNDGICSADAKSYSTARDADTADGCDTTSASSYYGAQSYTSYVYTVRRGFTMFDTSSLSGSVTGCSLYMYGYGVDEGSVYIFKGTQGDTLTVDDYHAYTGDSYGSMYVSSTEEWKSLSFNSTGRSGVTVGGTTYICGRSYRDYNDNSSEHRLQIRMTDYTGTDYDPYLSVTTVSAFTPKIICVC